MTHPIPSDPNRPASAAPGPRRRRRAGRAVVATATGLAAAAFVLAGPVAANAHVHVTPSSTEAGATSELAFSFSHGCDGSPTTGIEVTVPEEVASVALIANAGWQVAADLGEDGTRTVAFTADTPIPDGVRETLELEVALPEGAADGSQLVFPTLQQCETGEWLWADEDQGSETPAPLLTIGETADAHGHDHGAPAVDAEAEGEAAGGDHADHGGAPADAAAAAVAPAAESGASPAVPVSIAALVVAVLAAILGAAALRRQAQQR
ncbi:YcnI family copper-binding membrane protein [Agrococcus sp. Marseille-P2731]|uniref:YcnI family copper-binding membrane protein n=1 Tax=Agrococcus sp. Marseille-P2731 TaxID=1841862 RepID=UPI0009F886B9|nr:DUF1775 domain-containing protein [Agrococcus sp. Marseille-P2731]